MVNRFQQSFYPLPNSTAPMVELAVDNTSTSVELEATGREWQGPGGRAVRVSSFEAADGFLLFGSSTVTVAQDTGMPILGGTAEVFAIEPKQTYAAAISSTDMTLQFTLGYGF